jgi:phytoene dehydrogenase-like protein
VVVGSGIAGLSAAALLATYGQRVVCCESHTVIGGACHSFRRGEGYHFESGPSLYSGLKARGPQGNPLGLVLQAVGAELDVVHYDTWNVYLPETGHERFPAKVCVWRRACSRKDITYSLGFSLGFSLGLSLCCRWDRRDSMPYLRLQAMSRRRKNGGG